MTAIADRRTAEELLPFLVNGTLDANERALVRAQLATDSDLAEQEQVLRRIRTQMQTEETLYSPGEMGLARLMRDLDGQSRIADEPATVLGFERRPVFSALAAAIATVAVISGVNLMRGASDAPEAPVYYEQASGDAADAVLTIAFRPNATQTQMTELMLSYGLVMVDGPSALGLYRVAPLDGDDLTELAARLAAETDIIETVDTLQ